MKKIKIIGVGDTAIKVLNYFTENNDEDLDCCVIGSDEQVLISAKINDKILIDKTTIEDGTCGKILEKKIKYRLNNCNFVVLVSCFGGQTGSKLTPIIEKIILKNNIKVLPILTIPFSYEGKKRMDNAIIATKNITSNCIILRNNDILKDLKEKSTMNDALSLIDNKICSILNFITKNTDISFEKIEEFVKNSLNIENNFDKNQKLFKDLKQEQEKIKKDIIAEIDDYIKELEFLIEQKEKQKESTFKLTNILKYLKIVEQIKK